MADLTGTNEEKENLWIEEDEAEDYGFFDLENGLDEVDLTPVFYEYEEETSKTEKTEEKKTEEKKIEEKNTAEKKSVEIKETETHETEQKKGRSRAKKNRSLKDLKAVKETQPENESGAVETEEKEKKVSQEVKQPVSKKKIITAAGTLAAIVLLGGCGYFFAGQRYTSVFFPKTQINGVDASGKTPKEVERMIAEGVENYVLTIEGRDGKTEQITGKEIGLHSETDDSLEKLLSAQKPMQWMKYVLSPASHEAGMLVQYDESAFEKKLEKLDCMLPENMLPAENAVISEYIPGTGYTVLPETPGTVVRKERLREALSEAIKNLQEKAPLAEMGVYEDAAVKKEDPTLNDLCKRMNQAAGMTVTYRFGDKTEQLNGDRIHEWLTVDENLQISVDPEKAAEYVSELAGTYNTAYQSRQFKTSYGSVVEVKGGSYGWKINQKEETEALTAVVQAGENVEREPVYEQTGASRIGNDYGNTYVEINLTGQHLFFYQDGKLLLESDFVSGNLSRGWGTPAGTYPLTYKQRNAVLKGANYRTPVKYWMPFNGGIGMHDANWRGSFGGSIYKTNGSHGCINLPPSVAKQIFENISAGMPVICYEMPGTEKNTVTQKPVQPVKPAPQQPQPIPETPAPVLPTEPTQPIPSGPADEIGNQPAQPVPQPTQPVPQPTQPAPQPTQPAPQPTLAPPGPGADTGDAPANGPGA